MGLENLIDDEDSIESISKYKKYGHHEYNDILERWVDEFQDRFPEEVEIEFVEVSSAMESKAAYTYFRYINEEEICFIRISENVIDNEDWFIKQTVLHCMVDAYLRQLGADDIDAGHSIRNWVRGRVGCIINAVDVDSDEWKLIAEPFLEDDMKSDEMWI